MKTLYNFIAIAFFFIISNAVGQDRTTYWVHGLGGSGESWDLYRPQFSLERQMNGASPTYLTTNGIPDASRQLGANIGNDPGNFIIGHSLGGLAAREYERTPGSNPVNAILTIGTPHKGAFIATNVINGNARQTITYAVEEMTAGPFAEGKSMVTNILTAFFDLPGYVASRWANKQIDRVIEEDFYAEVRSKVIEFEGGFITNSLRDLQPGSNYLNGLNSTVRPVAIANIICEENDRPGLRLGNAALFSPANYPLDQYDDTGLIRAADQLEGAYRAFRIYHDVMKFANPLRAGHHNRLANKWQRGEDYIGGKFDAEYARLIGAVRSEVRTSTYWVEECTSSCMNDVARAFECIEDQQRTNCNWVQRTSTVAVTIMEKSDGLVTDDTQRMSGVPDDRVYRALGANHLEVGNNPAVRLQYNRVFDRIDQFGIQKRP